MSLKHDILNRFEQGYKNIREKFPGDPDVLSYVFCELAENAIRGATRLSPDDKEEVYSWLTYYAQKYSHIHDAEWVDETLEMLLEGGTLRRTAEDFFEEVRKENEAKEARSFRRPPPPRPPKKDGDVR